MHNLIEARHSKSTDAGATFDYTSLSGLDPRRYTIALRGIEMKTLGDGQLAPVIPNVVGLHYAIAVHLIGQPGPLDGSGVRFLRKLLQMTQAQFAEVVDLRPETLSRWERGRETPGEDAQIRLRLRVFHRIVQEPEVERRLRYAVVKDLLETLSERINVRSRARLQVTLSGAPTWVPEESSAS